jgi:tryptophan synthase alpha chain
MNRIEEKFKKLGKEKQKAFIAFITCGDPNLATTERLAREFDRLGVDILELGVPFSDPLADGPTIQAASQRALKNKVNLLDVLQLVKRVRYRTELPIALLSYYNIIYHFGIRKFVTQAKHAGVDGVIVPDLPVDEAKELIEVAKRYEFATIFLLAPTSDRKRIDQVAAHATGFIYYVSLTGTTGARKELPQQLSKQVQMIKKVTSKPICVGFGISTPRQISQIARVADGIIVGSAIINVIEKNLNRQDLISKVMQLVRRLSQAI